jgi:hypothetical protein
MALRDITVLREGTFGSTGTRKFAVAAGATAINAGEPVVRALAGTSVTAMATSKPVVGTDYVVGIAATASTNSASAAGYVEVLPASSDVVFAIAPKTATSWDTQAEYDALVGARVTLDLTSSTYTINASDSANNGCVIQPLDVAQNPGKVAFSFRRGALDLA